MSSSPIELHNLKNVLIRNSMIPEAVTAALLTELFAVPTKRAYIPAEYGDIHITSTDDQGLVVHMNAADFVQMCVKPIFSSVTDGFISYNKRTAYIKEQDGNVIYMTVNSQFKDKFVYPGDIQIRTQTPLPVEAVCQAA